MLVLSRRQGERIQIGDDVFITVVSMGHNKVRIGIEAPQNVSVLRSELEKVEFDDRKARSRLAAAT